MSACKLLNIRMVVAVIILQSCVVLGAEPEVFTRGGARLELQENGSFSLNLGAQTLLERAYVRIPAPTESEDVAATYPDEVHIERGDNTDRIRLVRQASKGAVLELTLVFSAEQLYSEWALRFPGYSAEDRAATEVGFFVPYASFDGWDVCRERFHAWDGSARVGVIDAAAGSDNPVLDRPDVPLQWLSFRKDGRRVRYELHQLAAQNLPGSYRVVFGGWATKDARLMRAVRVSWGQADAPDAYEEASGAKRHDLLTWARNQVAVDVCAGRRVLFTSDEHPWVAVRGVNLDDESQTLAVRWRLEDYWDRVVESGAMRLVLPPAGEVVRRLTLPQGRTGMFRLVADYGPADAGDVGSAQAIFGVVPPQTARPAGWESPFGMHVPDTPYHMTLAQQIGVDWVRAHDTARWVQWRFAEPEPGQWVWRDEAYQAFRERGFKILGVLNAPPRWATERAGGGSILDWPQEALEMWRNYCAQVIARYHGPINHWEVSNEWYGTYHIREHDEAVQRRAAANYVELLRIAREEADRVNPDIEIIGVCGPPKFYPWTWYEHVLDAGAGDFMNSISVHFYPTMFIWPPKDFEVQGPYTDIARSVRGVFSSRDKDMEIAAWHVQFQELLREYGLADMPVWNSESGTYWNETFYTDFEPGYRNSGGQPMDQIASFREVAGIIVRMSVVDAAFQTRRFTYTLSGGVWYFHSIAEQDQTPMPAAVAHAVMTHHLQGMEHYRSLPLGNYGQAYVFAGPDRAVACLWGTNRPDNDHALPLRLPASIKNCEIKLYDIMGVELALGDDAGHAAVPLTEQPLWMLIDAPQPEMLVEWLSTAVLLE